VKTALAQEDGDSWESLRKDLRAAYGDDAVSVDDRGRTVLTDGHGDRFVFLDEEAYRRLAGYVSDWSTSARAARRL
jgi:hypothetical protein